MPNLVKALLVIAWAFGVGSMANAQTYELILEERTINITGTPRPAVTVNGTVPGPILRLREGDEAVIRVTNRMSEATSIHWHGLILPAAMDGAPGFSTAFREGIAPGQTFEYRFRVRQSSDWLYCDWTATFTSPPLTP